MTPFGQTIDSGPLRESGVLLHITSLPAGEGIGDLGDAAYRFVDWLVAAGQRWWQVLPCVEVGFGESPYQSISAYAGNTLLISLKALVDDGLLDADELQINGGSAGSGEEAAAVNFAAVRQQKRLLLDRACENFLRAAAANSELQASFEKFENDPAQHWLHDYARFVVLQAKFGAVPWTAWPKEMVQRDAAALAELDALEEQALRTVRLQQFFFHRQWHALRAYATRAGIRLLGDCPIYVAADSVDVWCNPELFDLESDGSPRVVAGVPPDYFSATGQLWGNPLYRWDVMAKDGFAWWCARIAHCAQHFDLTRIDHFRGLEAFWEVPAQAPDASSGAWQPGPGAQLLNALAVSLGGDLPALPLVAEDLGELTDAVHALRAQFDLPGMRVLQFGFPGGEDNPHALDNIGTDVVVYAGTHDNNTTLGWLEELEADQRAAVLETLACDNNSDALVKLQVAALASDAPLAILTMQDLLQLDARARFNTPGTVGDNWRWRLRSEELSSQLAEWLAWRSKAAHRLPPARSARVSSATDNSFNRISTAGFEPSLVGEPIALKG